MHLLMAEADTEPDELLGGSLDLTTVTDESRFRVALTLILKVSIQKRIKCFHFSSLFLIFFTFLPTL